MSKRRKEQEEEKENSHESSSDVEIGPSTPTRNTDSELSDLEDEVPTLKSQLLCGREVLLTLLVLLLSSRTS
jgi:hypothetical protein